MTSTPPHQPDKPGSTIDSKEIANFTSIAKEWWDPAGKFRPLHKFNPVRIAYLREKLCEHFDRDPKDPGALEGLRVLDIGCGGGLLSEPMARMGAEVVGADAGETNIEVAKLHASQSGIDIDYRTTTAEEMAAAGETFDIVLNMEVVEHVADVNLFMTACANMVRPGGLTCVATINRTRKAQLLAIFMAENVLQWLPRGTHQYEKLVTPEEIVAPLEASGMEVVERTGVTYNPIADTWKRSRDTDVNYMILAKRPK